MGQAALQSVLNASFCYTGSPHESALTRQIVVRSNQGSRSLSKASAQVLGQHLGSDLPCVLILTVSTVIFHGRAIILSLGQPARADAVSANGGLVEQHKL